MKIISRNECFMAIEFADSIVTMEFDRNNRENLVITIDGVQLDCRIRQSQLHKQILGVISEFVKSLPIRNNWKEGLCCNTQYDPSLPDVIFGENCYSEWPKKVIH
jgi:hypothetical protein